MEPWRVVNSENNGPYAVKTLLGWVVCGPLKQCVTAAEHFGPITVTSNRISVMELKDLLIKQYNQDFCENRYEEKKEMSVDDKQFMSIASNNITLKDGHYYLPLPFKNENKLMPNNIEVAKERLQGLKRRFIKDLDYAAEYTAFMQDILKKGYAEEVPSKQLEGENGRVWYIPHHGVRHKKKLKLRVVFDCPSSYQGTSLNKELLQGPDLTNTLIGVLLRFRKEKIAVMADIEAMFYQVFVAENDRDSLRFLWWPDGDISKEPQVHRMRVHLFGAVSSPSIANFALRQTAEDNKHKYEQEKDRSEWPTVAQDPGEISPDDPESCDYLLSFCQKSVTFTLITDLRVRSYRLKHTGPYHIAAFTGNSTEALLENFRQFGSCREADLTLERFSRAFGVDATLMSSGRIVFVTDRGANIVAALRGYTRLNCSAHILNVILSSAFSEKVLEKTPDLAELLVGAKRLVKYFKHSGLQNRLATSLKQSVETRWNSNYEMLNSILSQHETISALLVDTAHYEKIVQINLNHLETLVAFLKVFKDATNDLESDNCTTSASLVLPGP
ncbi:hypothetical protein WMY93_028906 [Mugilogobius chulae]|uniref:Uncharacterized protein n=1 Tax=Mugilogobius chulae TaxID=88201 RepID=A0AAW0MUD3_9GOBI